LKYQIEGFAFPTATLSICCYLIIKRYQRVDHHLAYPNPPNDDNYIAMPRPYIA